jgi:hypothetical protein
MHTSKTHAPRTTYQFQEFIFTISVPYSFLHGHANIGYV